MVIKKYGHDKDFFSSGGALTLPLSAVSDEEEFYGTSSKTHESGWCITGLVHEDRFFWVERFEANHPHYGRVWGDFEKFVYADSEEGYQHFYTNHPPEAWDYWDI